MSLSIPLVLLEAGKVLQGRAIFHKKMLFSHASLGSCSDRLLGWIDLVLPYAILCRGQLFFAHLYLVMCALRGVFIKQCFAALWKCMWPYIYWYIYGLKYINGLKSMCLKRQEEMPWSQTAKPPPACAVAAATGQVLSKLSWRQGWLVDAPQEGFYSWFPWTCRKKWSWQNCFSKKNM